MPVARIPLVDAGSLTPAQQRVHDEIVNGPRRGMVGPLRAILHNPELAGPFQQLGAVVRYGTSLPQRLKEIAILVTARRWNAELEWQIHEGEARTAGVSDAIIEAIRVATPPPWTDQAEREVYDFVRELQETGQVSEPAYRAVHARHGTVGVVELSALVGYYTMVAMTLNAHQIVLPDGHAAAGTALPPVGPRDQLTTCAGNAPAPSPVDRRP
jgi:4-carboxymuconolactone decarboxylase